MSTRVPLFLSPINVAELEIDEIDGPGCVVDKLLSGREGWTVICVFSSLMREIQSE